jgi:hypothetical protein
MIQEPKPILPEALFYDDDSEEIMNDSLGTTDLSDATGLYSDEAPEEVGIGYANDERQD